MQSTHTKSNEYFNSVSEIYKAKQYLVTRKLSLFNII